MKKYDIGQVETVIKCEYGEIEKVIEDFFGLKQYSIPCEEETSNYSSLDFTINGELDKFDEKDVVDLLENKKIKQWRTRTYLNYMAREGVIIKGNYIISIFW